MPKLIALSLLLSAALNLASALATEPADSSELTATLIIPQDVPSFAGLTLRVMLFEFDPFLADAPANKFDELEVQDFAHRTGTETKKTFFLGEKVNGGKIRADRRYYLVTEIVDAAGKRTHYGDCTHRKGLCSVLSGDSPKKVEVKLRKL